MAGITKSLLFVAATTVLALGIFPVMAQVQPIVAPNCGFLGMNCTGTETFGSTISPYLLEIINIALALIGIIASGFLVIAGYLYVTSTGESDRAERAKNQIVYALLGLVVAGAAFILVNAVVARDAGPIQLYLLPFINMALSLVGIIATAFLVYAGYLYISSTGDEENSTRAKRQIFFALLGIFVAGTAGLIVNVVVFQETADLIISVRRVVNAVLTLLGIAAAAYILLGGVMYVSSTGDEDKSSRAKTQIIHALIGLVVIMLSAVAVNLIINAV